MFVVVVAAAAYEAAFAFGWLALGSSPGQGPAAEGVAVGAALLALVIGSCTLPFAPRGAASVAAAVLLAAAAFVVARFYTFDPYFAPGSRRSSEGGIFTGTWIASLCFVTVVTAVTTLWRPAIGMRAGSAVVVLCALTAFAMRVGH